MDVFLLGVNGVGYESGNTAASTGRDIPWLQDTTAANAWAAWSVTYRDVVILDRHQELFATYNLTTHDLAVVAHRDELKQLLRAAAAVP